MHEQQLAEQANLTLAISHSYLYSEGPTINSNVVLDSNSCSLLAGKEWTNKLVILEISKN